MKPASSRNSKPTNEGPGLPSTDVQRWLTLLAILWILYLLIRPASSS